MEPSGARLVGIELYVEDLPKARDLYTEVLDLPVVEEERAHHVMLCAEGGFVCLERKADRPWAVLPDPDGHSVILVQHSGGRGRPGPGEREAATTPESA